MSEANFIKALRTNVRYPSPKGAVTSEDLWKLSLTDLDATAVVLNEQLESAPKKSFLAKPTVGSEKTQLAFDNVLFVIQTKQAEAEQKLIEQERRDQKQRLLELKQQKKDERFNNMTEAEIDAELAKL